MDWQPIETAPKDGTVVDLWAQERDRYEHERITDCFYRFGVWRHLATIYDGEETYDDLDSTEVFGATHWMPLPPPPRPNHQPTHQQSAPQEGKV